MEIQEVLNKLITDLSSQDGLKFANELVMADSALMILLNNKHVKERVPKEVLTVLHKKLISEPRALNQTPKLFKYRSEEDDEVTPTEEVTDSKEEAVLIENTNEQIDALRREVASLKSDVAKIMHAKGIFPVKEEYYTSKSLIEALPEGSITIREKFREFSITPPCTSVDPSLLSYQVCNLQRKFRKLLYSDSEEHNKLKIINSHAYEEIKKILDEGDSEMNYGHFTGFMKGPIGVGKSLGLALNILRLRKEKGYLVFYISELYNSHPQVVMRQYFHMLLFGKIEDEERVRVFYQKLSAKFTIQGEPTFQNYFKFVRNKLEEGSESQFKNLLTLTARSFNVPMITVTDQACIDVNNPYKSTWQKLMEERMSSLIPPMNILVCTSQAWPDVWDRRLCEVTTPAIKGCFDDEQADQFFSNNIVDHNLLTPDLKRSLLDLVNKNPYELFFACQAYNQTSVKDYENIRSEYNTLRYNTLSRMHQVFLDSTKSELKGWYTCLAKKLLGFPISEADKSIDLNLCDKIVSFPESKLEFYCDIYWQFLQHKYKGEIRAAVAELLKPQTIETILPRLKLESVTVGDIMEKYFLIILETFTIGSYQRDWEFTYHRFISLKKDKITAEVKTPKISKLEAPNNLSFCTSYCLFKIQSFGLIGKNTISPKTAVNAIASSFQDDDISDTEIDGFSGVMYTFEAESSNSIDAIFASEQGWIFPIQITKTIKGHARSDEQFFKDLEKPSAIQKNLPLYRDFMMRLHNIKDKCRFQFIWIGFPTKSRPVEEIKIKGIDINEESWVIIPNETPPFDKYSKVLSDGKILERFNGTL